MHFASRRTDSPERDYLLGVIATGSSAQARLEDV